MNRGKALRLGAVALGCMAAGAVWAQDRGAYLGASFGKSTFSDVCEGVSISCDKTDNAWKLFGGYHFSRTLAAEVAYVDFGEVVTSGVIGTANVEGSWRSKAWEATAIGMLPVGQIALLLKFGVYYAMTDSRSTGTVPNFSSTGSFSDKNANMTFGVGARFDLMRNIGLQAEWQRYNDVGGNDTGKSDIDLLSLGVLYRFQ